MNARRAFSSRGSTTTGLPRAARATCWRARSSRRVPGFAGRQTDTGEEIEIEFTPDNQVHRLRAPPPIAMPRPTPSPIRSCSSSSINGGEPKQITQGSEQLVAAALHARRPHAAGHARNAGRRASTTRRGSRRSPGPTRASTTSSPTASIARWARSPCRRIRAGVFHGRGRRQREAVLHAPGRRHGADAVRRGEGRVHQPHHPGPRRQALDVRELGKRQLARRNCADRSRRTARRWCSPSSTHARAAQLDLPPIENFWFTSSRGKRIHSFVVRPPGFDASKKYPLFVVIHGGPHGMWRDQFFVRWNYHLLACARLRAAAH